MSEGIPGAAFGRQLIFRDKWFVFVMIITMEGFRFSRMCVFSRTSHLVIRQSVKQYDFLDVLSKIEPYENELSKV